MELHKLYLVGNLQAYSSSVCLCPLWLPSTGFRNPAVGNQVEEMMRFFNQKSGNNRKFEYSNRIDQNIGRCSQQNHDVLIPISKEGAQKIKVHSHDDHPKAV
jgi:hypothetical protein